MLDVASLAGVSPATVSRALNQPEIVKPRTLARIRQAIEATGYETNEVARSLRRQRSDTLLVMLGGAPSRFIFQVLMVLEARAAEENYTVLISNSAFHQERSQRYYNFIQKRLADGILTFGGSARILRKLHQIDAGLPIVAINESMEGQGFPYTSVDDFQAARLVVRHLRSLGHKRLGHVAGPLETSSGKLRLEGFLQELRSEGLQPGWIAQKDYSVESGSEAAREWLQLPNPPTAVFCSCDEVALSFVAVLQREGVRVPDDVSVVGFDDIPLAGYSCPSLTTIRQPHQELGATAFQMLLQRLQDPPTRQENSLLAGELVVRDSTGPPPGR